MKRIIALILAFTLLLCGCSGSGLRPSDYAENARESTASEADSPGAVNGAQTQTELDAAPLTSANTIYYSDEIIHPDYNLPLLATDGTCLYAANDRSVYTLAGTEVISYLTLPEQEWSEPGMTIEDMAVAKDVVWLKLITHTPVDEGTVSTYSIQGYKNSELFYVSDDVTTMPANQLDRSLAINEIETDAAGNLYALHNGFIRVMNPEGSALGDIQMDEIVTALTRGNDGNVYAETAMAQTQSIYRLDSASLSAEYVASRDVTALSGNRGEGYLLYQWYGYGIYGLSSDTLTWDLVADTSSLALSMDEVTACVPDGSDGFYLYHADSSLHHLMPSDTPAGNQKMTLTLATCNADAYLSIADAFNENSNAYSLVIHDYHTQLTDTREATRVLISDMRAGNAPDLIDLASFDQTQLVSFGLLEELTPYLGNDADFSVSDLLLYDALTEDGNLYQMVRDFTISIYYGSKDFYDGDGTWDYSQALDVVDQYSALGVWGTDQRDTLRILLKAYLPDHISYATQTCDLNNESFHRILEIAKSAHSTLTDDEVFTGIETDNKTAFEAAQAAAADSPSRLKKLWIAGAAELQQNMREVAQMTPVSVPTEDGSAYYDIQPQHCLGISAACQNKDAAWAVIHEMLNTEAASLSNIKSEFDALMESMLHPKTSYEGKEIILNEDGTFYADGELITETPYVESIDPYITEEQANQLYSALADARNIAYGDYVVIQIINDAVADYFSGSASVEDVAMNAQEQANQYLSSLN